MSPIPYTMHQTYLSVRDDLICCLSFFTVQQVHTHPLITSASSAASNATRVASIFPDFESWEEFSPLQWVTGVTVLVTVEVYILAGGILLVAEQHLHVEFSLQIA